MTRFPKITFLVPYLSFYGLLWLVILGIVPLSWSTGGFLTFFVLVAAVTSDRLTPPRK